MPYLHEFHVCLAGTLPRVPYGSPSIQIATRFQATTVLSLMPSLDHDLQTPAVVQNNLPSSYLHEAPLHKDATTNHATSPVEDPLLLKMENHYYQTEIDP